MSPDLWTIGADIGQMVTGLSVVTATYVWTRGRLSDRRERKAAIRQRTWGGYIDQSGINTWLVQLAEEPDRPTGRVVLDVVDGKGEPSVNGAHSLRQRIIGEGMLGRVPTTEEYELLAALQKERGYGKGFPVR